MQMKTFKYRVYPTKKQHRLLTEQLEECRWLWNFFLAERKTAWEERHEPIRLFDQINELPALKADLRPGLKDVHSQVLQNVAKRQDGAMDAYFRRIKAGETPGYPRFKSRGRYDSLTYPQWSNGITLNAKHDRLIASKIGDIKLIYHRPLEGTPKTVTIRRTATDKWFVTISCEWEPTALPPTGKQVGLDMGLKTFATLSDGHEIANPRFFRSEEHELAKAQRKHQGALDAHKAVRKEVTEQVKTAHPDLDAQAIWQFVSADPQEHVAWQERQKRRKVVARTHERITWKRDNFTHQHSRQIVNHCDLIVVEDLNIVNMVQLHTLAKSIHDVAWGQFAELLRVKAAWAGRVFIAVNPAYTSQTCSGCGHRKTDLTLADRVYHCLQCGLVIDRDLNAALNILRLGLPSLASA